MVFTAVDPELLSCLIEASEDETETEEDQDWTTPNEDGISYDF